MSLTYRVAISAAAAGDLADIDSYLTGHAGIDVADRWLGQLNAAMTSLTTFPDRGSIPPELQGLGITRFRQQLLTPYRIIYRADSGTEVLVLIVADGRRDMRTLLEHRLLRS